MRQLIWNSAESLVSLIILGIVLLVLQLVHYRQRRAFENNTGIPVEYYCVGDSPYFNALFRVVIVDHEVRIYEN